MSFTRGDRFLTPGGTLFELESLEDNVMTFKVIHSPHYTSWHYAKYVGETQINAITRALKYIGRRDLGRLLYG